ncbi:ABC transporter substrate-binding protein [uncultured Ruegeria sp.]|uniref:ABC transporter substrate-binding protein n=1 Tax=uncultured Ruegeria sp. TaxID=259304 RepID=UPI00261742F8|nr:ABC transporter substrate-binding protein [uncultured Ruegeria sp.]
MANSKTSYMSRRSVLRAGAAALAAPTFFVGKAHAANEKLKVGLLPGFAFGLYWVIQEEGFAPGVEMEYDIFPSGPPAIEAMVGESVEVITVGSVPPLIAMSRKIADFREISIVTDAGPLFTIVGKPGINGLADLEGKRVGVTTGSNFDYFLDTALELAGLKGLEMQRVNMEPMDGGAALIAGAIDATLPSLAAKAAIFDALPEASMVVDGAELQGAQRPKILDMLMTTQQVIDAKEEALVEIVSAYHSKAIPMMREDYDGTVELITRWLKGVGRPNVTTDDVAPLLGVTDYQDRQGIKDAYASGEIKDAFELQSNFLLKNESIGELPDLDALVDDTIVKKI